MIGVFRIHVGQAWSLGGREAALMGLFDTLPEFLVQASSLSPEVMAAAPTPEAQRSAVRIALTQVHVVVLPADAVGCWTSHEIDIASSGLRRRIPIVAVDSPDRRPRAASVEQLADRLVPWHAPDVACAILEVVEAAAAERREALRHLDADAEDLAGHAPEAGAEHEEPDAEPIRDLPTEKIIEAYAALKARQARALGPDSGTA